MTNKKHIFETKEQYLNFLAVWKKATNSVRCKPHLEDCDEWISATESLSRQTGKALIPGWLTAEHYMLNNIIRGKDLHNGFTPVTNKNKLANGWEADQTFKMTKFSLGRIIGGNYRTGEFLKPFADLNVKDPKSFSDIFTPEQIEAMLNVLKEGE